MQSNIYLHTLSLTDTIDTFPSLSLSLYCRMLVVTSFFTVPNRNSYCISLSFVPFSQILFFFFCRENHKVSFFVSCLYQKFEHSNIESRILECKSLDPHADSEPFLLIGCHLHCSKFAEVFAKLFGVSGYGLRFLFDVSESGKWFWLWVFCVWVFLTCFQYFGVVFYIWFVFEGFAIWWAW